MKPSLLRPFPSSSSRGLIETWMLESSVVDRCSVVRLSDAAFGLERRSRRFLISLREAGGGRGKRVPETAGFEGNRGLGLGPLLVRRTSLSSHRPSGPAPVQRSSLTSVCLSAKKENGSSVAITRARDKDATLLHPGCRWNWRPFCHFPLALDKCSLPLNLEIRATFLVRDHDY
jgi:hypothetical protein